MQQIRFNIKTFLNDIFFDLFLKVFVPDFFLDILTLYVCFSDSILFIWFFLFLVCLR